jgi:ubiquinone/menaquinone biosynthesis C-methylase UbiE
MRRIKEEFLDIVEENISLDGMDVLEIGCGTGARSVAIAGRCKFLEAVEPNEKAVEEAQQANQKANIRYKQGAAEKLPYEDHYFDVCIFTLSLHHVPVDMMNTAISESVRVAKKGGHIVFLEPAHAGSYFKSEINFDAGDGDERAVKARAYFEILNFKNYTESIEIDDETIFKLDSAEDFVTVFSPRKNLDKLPKFLEDQNFTLNAMRRISIYKV